MKEIQQEQAWSLHAEPGWQQSPGQPYYIGVDGGGSKTLAVLVDATGKELARGLAESANYQVVGLERAAANIIQAVSQAKLTAQLSGEALRAWFGLSGVDRPGDSLLFQPYLGVLAEQVQITNDADLLLGALKESCGIALIAGTGSIALGQNKHGVQMRAGGWGYVFGDEGSGYILACQGLQAVARAADGRGSATLLLDLILHYWHLTDPEEILGEVYKDNDKARIARLSTCVLQAARQGDSQAQAIVRQGAQELALLVRTLSQKLDFVQQPLRLALGGGLLLHEQEYRQLVLDELQKQQILEQVELVEQPALSAARALSGQNR
jgi:N-acetylglucosamine kinase-like BadF-type ATPase